MESGNPSNISPQQSPANHPNSLLCFSTPPTTKPSPLLFPLCFYHLLLWFHLSAPFPKSVGLLEESISVSEINWLSQYLTYICPKMMRHYKKFSQPSDSKTYSDMEQETPETALLLPSMEKSHHCCYDSATLISCGGPTDESATPDLGVFLVASVLLSLSCGGDSSHRLVSSCIGKPLFSFLKGGKTDEFSPSCPVKNTHCADPSVCSTACILISLSRGSGQRVMTKAKGKRLVSLMNGDCSASADVKGNKRKRVGSAFHPLASQKRHRSSALAGGGHHADAHPAAAPPAEFTRQIISMGGDESSIRLVIQKELTKTDLTASQARLSMPNKQTNLPLTDAEAATLESRGSNRKPEKIYVPVIDPSLTRRELALKKWFYGSTWSYVLCGAWNELAVANGLEKGDVVQVWSFRFQEDDRLAMATVRVPQASDSAAALSSVGSGSTTASDAHVVHIGQASYATGALASVGLGSTTAFGSYQLPTFKWGRTARRQQRRSQNRN